MVRDSRFICVGWLDLKGTKVQTLDFFLGMHLGQLVRQTKREKRKGVSRSFIRSLLYTSPLRPQTLMALVVVFFFIPIRSLPTLDAKLQENIAVLTLSSRTLTVDERREWICGTYVIYFLKE